MCSDNTLSVENTSKSRQDAMYHCLHTSLVIFCAQNYNNIKLLIVFRN